MRIVGGQYKGLRVQMPKAVTIRPTTDRAREGLFNILSHRYVIEGANVLDLFGGSGIVSMEFASRHAANIACVEKDRRVSTAIMNELKRLNISDVIVKTAEALKFLERCNEQFDIIFADPPYHLPLVSSLSEKIRQAGILKENGIFILEHEANVVPSPTNMIEQRNYGQSVFSFYSYGE